MSRRPNSSASCAVPLTRTCQPARPCETKSSVAMALETWNGSVWVTVATGISPMWFGHRRHSRGDQHRVGAARQPAGIDLGTAAPLRQ